MKENKRNSTFGKEVEYFNGKEWKTISSYSRGDKILTFFAEDNHVELLEPIQYIRKNNTLYRVQIKGLDFSLNGGATFIGEYRNSYKSQNADYDSNVKIQYIVTMEEMVNSNFVICSHFKAYNTFKYNSTTTSMLSSDQLRIMALSIMYGEIDGMWCTLRTKNKNLYKHLLKCINHERINHKKISSKDEYIVEYLMPRSKELFCTSPLMLSAEEVIVLVDEFDKGFAKNKMMCNDSQIKDFIQLVYAMYGKRIIVNDKHITKSQNGYTLLEREGKHERSKERLCYSFTTRSGYFVIRNNGRIYIVGDLKRQG